MKADKAKAEAVALFGGSCQRCGYAKCLRALHFHHLDPATKKDWSNGRGHVSLAEVRTHPERFVLVCANCHAEEHDALEKAQQVFATCATCGVSFRTAAYRPKVNRGTYCSRECRHKPRNAAARDAVMDRIRKHTSQQGNCLVWDSTCVEGFPAIQIRQPSGKYTSRSVARLLYEEQHGPLPEQRGLRQQCGTPQCVSPDHHVPSVATKKSAGTQRSVGGA